MRRAELRGEVRPFNGAGVEPSALSGRWGPGWGAFSWIGSDTDTDIPSPDCAALACADLGRHCEEATDESEAACGACLEGWVLDGAACVPAPCEAGTFDAAEAGAFPDCQALTVCGEGEFECVAATATSDRECAAISECVEGEFEVAAPTATSDRVCQVLRECGAGEFEALAATATSDRVCQVLTV